MRAGCAAGGFFAVFDHGLHLCGFDSGEQWLKFVDARADERRFRLIPTGDRIVQQFAGLFGQLRQHRREINRQLPKQIERDRANVLQLACAVHGSLRSVHGALASTY